MLCQSRSGFCAPNLNKKCLLISKSSTLLQEASWGVENTKYQVETVGLGRMEHLFLQCDMISGQLNFKGALQKKGPFSIQCPQRGLSGHCLLLGPLFCKFPLFINVKIKSD